MPLFPSKSVNTKLLISGRNLCGRFSEGISLFLSAQAQDVAIKTCYLMVQSKQNGSIKTKIVTTTTAFTFPLNKVVFLVMI